MAHTPWYSDYSMAHTPWYGDYSTISTVVTAVDISSRSKKNLQHQLAAVSILLDHEYCKRNHKIQRPLQIFCTDTESIRPHVPDCFWNVSFAHTGWRMNRFLLYPWRPRLIKKDYQWIPLSTPVNFCWKIHKWHEILLTSFTVKLSGSITDGEKTLE
jgi:hypothetical protein